ncbi:putative 3-demethylubiquinone-9 3-methyltransferase [Glonium stellatum]|uniref:Putative 3-demethylubiquinone-9 3-methyltransferase n=1 Tax=Glonium stellatum TaxID=574774 RepID=A0A8E2F735_9PEZI|nr:putative 3-demethylubiquinone-9 3-methyltransferase [Glonium stellatum]
MSLNKITPCLWFNGQAEEAANFYTSIFKNSKVTKIQRYTEAGKEAHGQEPGSVLVTAFELNGQPFVALNGGPQFKFNEAISFQIDCANQEEVDYYWEHLGKDADGSKQQCGWLGDKFGVVWQVVPTALKEMLGDSDVERVKRVTVAMMAMKKLNIAELRKAYEG